MKGEIKMVKTFAEWVHSVQAELEKLESVKSYLNATGEERRRAFSLLYDLSDFCDTASELVCMIDNPEGIFKSEFSILRSNQIMSAIHRLRLIALREPESAESAPKVERIQDKIINQLHELKKNHPDQVILIETPNGTVSLKIGEAQIFEGMRGEIVVDNE